MCGCCYKYAHFKSTSSITTKQAIKYESYQQAHILCSQSPLLRRGRVLDKSWLSAFPPHRSRGSMKRNKRQCSPHEAAFLNAVPLHAVAVFNSVPSQEDVFLNSIPLHNAVFLNSVPQHEVVFLNSVLLHEAVFLDSVPLYEAVFLNSVPLHEAAFRNSVPVPLHEAAFLNSVRKHALLNTVHMQVKFIGTFLSISHTDTFYPFRTGLYQLLYISTAFN